MVNVRCANLKDIERVVQFAKTVKAKHNILSEIEFSDRDASMWLANCIMTTGIYPFVAEKDDRICGLLVLTEMSRPWNTQHRYLTDLVFIAETGGAKLIRTAKALAKKKNIKSLLLSVSSRKERSDKFLNHIGQYAGGIYEIEV